MALTEEQQGISDALELVRLRRRHLAHSPNAEREKELKEAEEYLDSLLAVYDGRERTPADARGLR